MEDRYARRLMPRRMEGQVMHRKGIWAAVCISILVVIALVVLLALSHRRTQSHAFRGTSGLVCIDPGHGGTDEGATANGVVEKDVNLDIALRAKPLVEARGYRVIMTRETDKTVSLKDRCAIANRARASIFVSIHNNSSVTDDQGTETYYYDSGAGRHLATYIQREVVRRILRPNLGVTADELYALRNTDMPSALLECAYLTNEEEAQLILEPGFQQKIADGVAAGIDDYLKSLW
jgi:N-acetylmuramoyl-L-alanine amidase